MASTVPARASSTARSTAWAATRPASSGRRAWGALRPSLPSTVTSASSGPSARAFAATSGPMPRGSPTVTARRGRATRSGADVDVRRAAQDLEVVLYRELLAHVLADPILHVVEGQLTLGQALHELENHEFGPPRIHAHGEHRLQSGDGIAADRARVVRRQLRHGQLGHDLALRGIAVAARQGVERRARAESVVDRIGQPARQRDLGSRRSEERRVGKEWRSRWSTYEEHKKRK